MLKQLRNKKTAKKIWIGLAVIIVPAFVFWGLGSATRGSKENEIAGKIFGRSVSPLEYSDSLNAVRNQAVMQFGENFSEIQKYINLEQQAWDRLILLYEAKKRKLQASDKEVADLIQSYPFFQRKGIFDNRTYTQMLEYVFRTQPRMFEEQIRQSIILSKLYNQITENIKVNEDEIKEGYKKANQEMSVSYIAGIFTDFAKEINPSDEELKDYFAKNQIEFKQPISFNLEYLSAVTETAVKDALKRIAKKEELQKIAKDLNLELKETGLFNLGDSIPGLGWSPQALSIISKLKTGDFSPPLSIDNKYYILKLKERKEPYIPELSEIKNKVKETFIKDRSRKTAQERIGAALKKLTRDKDAGVKLPNFDKIAKESGLKSADTALFKYGSYIEGVGASDNFWNAGKVLKEGGFSGIITQPEGFYIIKTKEIMPIDEQKFNAEKKDFSQKLLAQKKEDTFVKFLEELKKKAQ